MIHAEQLYNFLNEQGVDFYTGVPDSLLRHFLQYIQDHAPKEKHVITANEGLAIALAAGYHLNSGKIPLVYLQNSGLGNTINPLTSLTNKEMYSVPMLLMIGWRGRPGIKDEPQHKKMGAITSPLLDLLEVPHYLLEKDEEASFKKIEQAVAKAISIQGPVALLVPEEIFELYNGNAQPDPYTLERMEVVRRIIDRLDKNDTVICTTGKIGREFYEQNLAAGKKISRYLLNTGAMGHANQIGLGILMAGIPRVIILDGDGSLLMHLGALPTIAAQIKNGFIHILLNNGCHESVGGQPTAALSADCCGIATACGFKKIFRIVNDAELQDWLSNHCNSGETQFVEIRISRKSEKVTGRPAGKPEDWKNDFMAALRNKP